ncbi:TIGR03086 family metal-binding protein [Glutamicibacter endophyticus]
MSFERTVILPVAAEVAFDLVTDPARIRRWQSVACRVDLRLGGGFRYTMGPGHQATGTFTEIEPGRRLVFDWGWEGSDEVPPGATTVFLTLELVDGGTALTLRHEGLGPQQAASHAEGWNHFLDRLTQYAATGHPVFDEWNACPEPENPLVSAEASLAALQFALDRLTEADSTHQTPCTEFTVADLVDHLAKNLALIGVALGLDLTDRPALQPEPRIASLAQPVLEAFYGHGLTGELTLGSTSLPASVVAGILNLELLVHGWDFAQATAQDFPVDPGLAEYVLGLAHEVIGAPQRASGSFGPPTAIAESADSMDRLLAFTGRFPAPAGQLSHA